ncbi:methyltransferase domain-containing protein [Pedobacter sp. PAMC26386]|nr:methyltransferase domain-containing protein [Pedobacter sp. PAMC26386]
MFVETTHRSTAPEIMDNFEMKGEILRDALDKIASINRLLGGNKVTLEGIKFLLCSQPKSAIIRITDIGCGNGDMLRALSDYASQHRLNFILIGIDANNFTVEHARSLSAGYENISYQCLDIFDDLKTHQQTDIILCTLTLHHFKDQEIIELLQSFGRNARLGFVINDLQRSAIAYYLFRGLCFIFGLNEMSREDGLTSILRGFKKEDLIAYSRTLGLKNYLIKWKWAFRYQWIVKIA